MVSGEPRSAALALAALLAVGCFDVAEVAPGDLVIDDFDDGDLDPNVLPFTRWRCDSFNPNTNTDFHCDHAAGYSSAYALFVEFGVSDAPDGTQQFGGAALATQTAMGTFDLTPFEEITFSLMIQNGTPPIASDAPLYVELACSSAPGSNGSPNPFYIHHPVTYADGWASFTFPLADFVTPSWENLMHLDGGRPACLRVVDDIRFSLNARLPDGQSGRATMFIDDVRLR